VAETDTDDFKAARVLSLQDDILVMIFELCLPDTRFSQVCVAWRVLAIGTPCLWTSIDFFRSELTVSGIERLHRVRDSIFDVEFCEQFMIGQGVPVGPCIDAYTAKSSNVRKLSVRCCNARTAARIFRSHKPPLELEELDIRANYIENSEYSFDNSAAEPDDPIPLEFGPDLFDGSAPRLHKLMLYEVYIDPSWPPYSQLRACHIKVVSYDCKIGVRKLLSLFDAMPLLEDFAAERIVDEEGLMTTTPKKVSLSRVREFFLEDHVPCLAAVFGHLSFPPTAVLSIINAYQEVEPTEAHGLLQAVSPHLANNRERFLASTAVIEVDFSQSYFTAKDHNSDKCWIKFCLCMDASLFVTTFSAHLPLDGMRHLQVPRDLWAPTPLGRQAWDTIFASMPQIESVVVNEVHVPNLCEALATSSPVCPLLHRLELLQYSHMHMLETMDSGYTMLDLIADTMKARRDLGVPIRDLLLEHVQMEDARALCDELFARGLEFQVVEDDEEAEGELEGWEEEWSDDEDGECGKLWYKGFLQSLRDSKLQRRLLVAREG
jgi:hypothetical protein